MPGLSETASELESIARHLRRAGEVELVRDLQKAIRDAVSPVPKAIRAGLDDHMPDRYAAELNADLALTVSVRTGDRNPGVTIFGKARGKARKLANLDAGRLTHPVYGNREVWRTQTDGVVKGWFTGPCEKAAPRVRQAILAALNDVSERAVRKGP
jgi:hypothetical protein